MTCPYLRQKLAPPIVGGICDLPELETPERVFCQGSKMLCQFPLKLALVESEPVVDDPDPTYSEYIHNGYLLGDLE